MNVENFLRTAFSIEHVVAFISTQRGKREKRGKESEEKFSK